MISRLPKDSLDAFIDAAPDPMILVNQAGEIVFANRRVLDVFGWTREELHGKNVELLVPEALRGSHVDSRNNYFANPQVRPMGVGRELWGVRKDGSLVPIEISLSPIQLSEGKGAIAVARDVTHAHKNQRKLAKHAAKLAQSNRDLEQFAYVASHDLQEPLRSIASHLQILGKSKSIISESREEKFINQSIAATIRMKNLVTDLLSYSRVTTKANPLAPVDLRMIVIQAQSNLEVAIEESGAQVHVSDLPWVFGDQVQLVQLVQNLLSNAIKFCDKNEPCIQIGATTFGRQVRIEVSDNGIGVDSAYQEKIFEILQRLHSQHEYEGTGIGLAICKRIIERHEGEIGVESEEGKGATFWFTLNLDRSKIV